MGQRSESRGLFVELVDVLRARLCACRGLKLRFMLLVRTGGYGDLWGVKLVHRAGCYVVARAALEVRQNALEVVNGVVEGGVGDGGSAQSGMISVEDVDRFRKERTRDLFGRLLKDKGELVKFAMTELFDKENGIKMRDHRGRLRRVRNSFKASEVVDWMVERTGVVDRERFVVICERLRREGLITRVGREKEFEDDGHLYTSDVTLHQSDSSCARVKTGDGQVLHCWTELNHDHAVKSVDLKLPVDIIDLQSVDFWSIGAFDSSLKKGDRFGFRLVAHPLMCQGLNIDHYVEPALEQPSFAEGSLAAASNNLQMSSQALAATVTQDLARIAVGQAEQNNSASPSQQSSNVPSKSALTSSAVAKSLVSIANDGASDAYESNTDFDSISMASAGVGGWEGGVIVSSIKVIKVFSSIARPMITALRRMIPEGDIDNDGNYETIKPYVLIKEGDNLLQDMSTEIMFRAFNNIWERSPKIFPDPHQAPFIVCYEVLPTDATRGFMEVIPHLQSLTEFNWLTWKRDFGNSPLVVDSILRSAAGSYIGAYVLGARDRHFDNIVVQNNRTVTHIDFGFVLGTSPPIDGPQFSIAPEMEHVFKDLGVWNRFVSLCVKGFHALRKSGPAVVRTTTMLFSRAGHDAEVIKEYMRGKNSLNVRESTPKALQYIKSQLETSSTDWKAKFKSYSHEKIDPVFYGLLEKRFPPAVLAMKVVNRLDHKAERKLASMGGENKASISAEETLEL